MNVFRVAAGPEIVLVRLKDWTVDNKTRPVIGAKVEMGEVKSGG